MSKDLTIIMPAFNNNEILTQVVSRLLETNPPNTQIIVVDDGSHKTINPPTHSTLRIIRNQHNIGVGASFDVGVKAADTERIVLMGSDVIVPEYWYYYVTKLLDYYPLSITCSISSGFAGEQKPFRELRPIRYGAHILRTHEHKLGYMGKNKVMLPDIIQAQWNSGIPDFGDEVVAPVNCILGAFYMTTKTVYNAIGGWMGHRLWGGLEPMISIRARRMGYKLYVARDLETAHNFGRIKASDGKKPGRERISRWDIYLYNKLLMAETMFEEPSEIKDFLYSRGMNNWLTEAERLIRKAPIEDIREFHRQNWIGGLIKKGEEL